MSGGRVTDERLAELIDEVDHMVSSYTEGAFGHDCYVALRELQSLRAKVGTHVLVPREPTLEMKVAGIEATRAAGNKSVASVYRAMLRAAGEQP